MWAFWYSHVPTGTLVNFRGRSIFPPRSRVGIFQIRLSGKWNQTMKAVQGDAGFPLTTLVNDIIPDG